MKFKCDWLADTIDSEVSVVDEIVDTRRWSIQYHRVIKHEGKFYQADYERGATEYQDGRPYENDGVEMECPEVFPVQKTITVYETKPC